MITVSDVVVLRTSRMVERGIDPLGIGLKHDEQLKRARSVIERSIAGVDDATRERLVNVVRDQLARTRTIGNPQGVMPLDPIAAQCLAHRGVDPLVAVHLALDIGMVAFDDLKTGYQAASVDGTSPADQASTEMNLGDASWTQRSNWGTVRLIVARRVLPDTMHALVGGRPLRELVSHPVLDRYDLSIVDIDVREIVIHLHTDHRPRPATMDQVIAASAGMRA
jgi:hypothetical protein